jgi:hypothetical protein
MEGSGSLCLGYWKRKYQIGCLYISLFIITLVLNNLFFIYRFWRGDYFLSSERMEENGEGESGGWGGWAKGDGWRRGVWKEWWWVEEMKGRKMVE